MAATIKIKNSSTAGAAPTSSDLVQGELAVNVTDKRLFTENSGGTVVELGTNPSTLTVTAGATIQGLTVGKGAGAVSTNTAVGASALTSNSTGAESVAIGFSAAYSALGSYNTTVGSKAFSYGTGGTSTGSYNTVLGAQALQSNTTASNNTAVGYQSLYTNSTGTQSVAVGGQSLYNNNANYNTAIGYQSAQANTSGIHNSALGYGALNSNTTGSYNTALGDTALVSNTTASYSTAVGYQAGYSSTADSVAYFGHTAGYTTTGTANTFIGQQAGYYVSTGAKNTILGRYNGNQGGLDIRTASNYIVLSDGDGNPCAYRYSTGQWSLGLGGTTAGSYEGSLRLNGAATTGRGAALQGDSNGTFSWSIGDYAYVVSGTSRFLAMSNSGGGGVYLNGSSATSWTAVSDETRKVIIEPITDAANKVATLRTVIGRLKSDDETVRRPYLIAQDVQAVLPEAVTEAEDKEGPVLGLSYTEVIPLLVAAIKELKAEIDTLKGQA